MRRRDPRFFVARRAQRAIWFALVLTAPVHAVAGETIQFNRDIRPLLSDKCFQCHGPDQAQRQADLRLDVEASAKRQLDGVRPIAPGDPVASELYRRITAGDEAERMPPPDSGKTLSPGEIETLARWIRAGAPWQKHWSFIAPVRPAIPPLSNPRWSGNPIDAFVLESLEAQGLEPSAEADRTTLIRRVTLDLTGLPPTPGEVDAFLADQSPDAYERLVDRLMASPRYGERMAARWLDAARYADTNGYQDDGIRHMWRWRDWVIEAYNRNLPFDRFTIEQIAGDLLPEATLEQRLATAFNRNHRTNAEGGIIAEEYAVEYVVDRVDTTATVWLGLTLGCARCHDHKFDPFMQREFYGLFAYFNNVPEHGRGIKVGNSPPFIKVPTRDQRRDLAAIERELADAEDAFARLSDEITALQSEWAARFTPSGPIHWAPADSLVAHFPLDADGANALGDDPSSDHPPANVDGALLFDAGSVDRAADFDGATTIVAGDIADFGFFDRFTISAWILPRSQNGTIVARMSLGATIEGYSLELVEGRLQLNLSKRWLDDAVRVETTEPLELGRWQHVAATYDGSRRAAGVRLDVDGEPRAITPLLDELNQTFETDQPLRIAGGGRSPAFDGRIDELRIYASDLTPTDVQILAAPASIDAILATQPDERTPLEAAKLRAYYLQAHAPPPLTLVRDRVAELRQKHRELDESFPTAMVMVEMSKPRETFVLARGQYGKPTERVAPAVPAALHPLPPGAPASRLGFAHWLVDPANPLTARVAVNRYWQAYFGTGLVKTVDDFGSQGEAPSHPDLLDWLACEFVASGWDTKAMQRLIVTSATYRQSSAAPPDAFRTDPENRRLARGPRLRLPAEMIRDSALAASGLLVEQLGGPSARPYQPPGLWSELTGGGDFEQDHGAGLYRRSLYTYWKRTIAPPTMIAFDASPREACTVRETRTNTPLQALALLNETTYVEAARVLAGRVMTSAATRDERLALAFRCVLARRPSAREARVLAGSFERHLAKFRCEPEAAEMLLAVGEAKHDKRHDKCELAAYAAVANLILNLDEAVTKE